MSGLILGLALGIVIGACGLLAICALVAGARSEKFFEEWETEQRVDRG